MKIAKCILSAFFLSVLSVAGAAFAENTAKDTQWQSYIEPLIPLGDKILQKSGELEDSRLRQDINQALFSAIAQGYVGLFMGDPRHPDFWPLVNIAFNHLAPNPDDAYHLAHVDGKGVYRISGYRGTTRLIDIQAGSGSFFTRGITDAGPSYGNYNLDELDMDENGRFDVILSNKKPEGYKGDWWELDPRVTYILIRQVAYDWNNERDARFSIDRLDTPAIKPPPTPEAVAENLRQLSAWAENWVTYGVERVKSYKTRGLVNKLSVSAIPEGGVTTQKYIEGQFEVADDEALIYETEVPEHCKYWNIQLADLVWRSIDWINYQSSLNGHTAKLDKDGKFRAVIAGTDPGVPNWLDTAGYSKGAITGRWKDCSSSPTPVITRVKLKDLRKYLPKDTPVVSAAERDSAIRLRREGAQLRNRW